MSATIKKLPTVNLRDEKNGYTPLVYAVIADRIKAVDLLLDNGADVDFPTDKGVTALEAAIRSKYWEGSDMVRHLLSRGASTESVREKLPTLNLTGVMKYWIQRAEARPKMTPEKQQRLKSVGCQRLPELEMSVIGQQPAIALLCKLVQSFMANRERSDPLVLAF